MKPVFDLETAVADWRRQMLAAGIQAPVPLDELENHLREEIERGIKSGLDEAQAVTRAVQSIGQIGALRNEFNKVSTGHGTLRTLGLIIGWLAAGYALFDALMSLEFHWNFFNFHENWDAKTIRIIAQFLAVGVGFWFLAKASRDRASRVASLLICLFLAGLAICAVLPPETLTQAHMRPEHSSDSAASALVTLALDKVFSRHAPSPLWYRGCLTALFFVPGIFWARQMRRQIFPKRPEDKNRPLHSC
jgi:uncharacterized membrane protein YciS (DUF1049 family)